LRRRALRSFIAWVGGKRQLAKQIVAMMPPHKAYVEVFGGAGWVLFAKPKEASKAEIFNDINQDLINPYRVIRSRLAEFYCRQQYLVTSRIEFRDFLERGRSSAWLDDVERAVGFYYLLKSSFASKGRTFYLDRTRAPGYRPDRVFLEEIRERLCNVVLECRDFEQLIHACDRPDTFFYCDPPYAAGSYYRHQFTEEDHRRLAQVLRGIKGRFLLSYDNAPFIRELYPGCTIEETRPVNYSMNNRGGQSRHRSELLIRNY